MNPFDKMGKTLSEQMQKVFNENSSIQMEFGTITSDFALKVTRFDTAIPKGEYYIDKRLAIDYKPEINITTSNANNHNHTAKIPITEGIEQIKQGDKVLVCWVGIDAVVIAVVVNSTDIKKET